MTTKVNKQDDPMGVWSAVQPHIHSDNGDYIFEGGYVSAIKSWPETTIMDTKVKQAKHTPGPWQYYADLPSVDPNWHIVTNASHLRILANIHIEPENEMDSANARLIAAAPELLESLKQVVASLEYWFPRNGDSEGVNSVMMKTAHTAIAKAEGTATL